MTVNLLNLLILLVLIPIFRRLFFALGEHQPFNHPLKNIQVNEYQVNLELLSLVDYVHFSVVYINDEYTDIQKAVRIVSMILSFLISIWYICKISRLRRHLKSQLSSWTFINLLYIQASFLRYNWQYCSWCFYSTGYTRLNKLRMKNFIDNLSQKAKPR